MAKVNWHFYAENGYVYTEEDLDENAYDLGQVIDFNDGKYMITNINPDWRDHHATITNVLNLTVD